MAPKLYQVKSKTKEDVVYTVDMIIGRCECFAGKDGSACWHQYCLWSKGFASSFHFLPKFDTFQRKRFAKIAVGKSLESSFYESLRLKKNEIYEGETGLTDSVRMQRNNKVESKTNELEGKTDGASHDSFTEQASEMFDNFFETVKEEIKNENKELNVALIKFIKRFESFSQTQNSKFWYHIFR